MNFNSGSRLVFIIFVIAIAILIALLVLFAILAKKKNKAPAVLKAFTIVAALIVMAGCFIFPLSYYGDIPLNLQYGTYLAYTSANYLKVHRDSVSLHKDGASNGLKGTYTLKNDVLEITYQDGTKDKFVVKHFGRELVDAETNRKAYDYKG